MWEDIAFLGAGGFLLGSLAYTGWYTTKYEPEARLGYLVIGIGVLAVVIESTLLEFEVHKTHLYLVIALMGYAIVALGLTLITRARQKVRKGGELNERGSRRKWR